VITTSNICDVFLEREKEVLSPFAFLTANTRGRDHAYSPCPNRTEFQRDRDRIIHSNAFRRLMNKTQVFLSPADEAYRTRMTHTLEVTQIARIIARALRLNEDLTEAAALGHDLGHTPFGHAGEAIMQECYSREFTHYKQSLRVVEKLERNGVGLNLTWEVRDGIVNHTGEFMASTLEGVIVKYADRIAYINHDIDDACHAGIITLDDIPAELRDVLGVGHSERINRMVTSVIAYSTDRNEIGMEPHIYEATMRLREFLFKTVYRNPVTMSEEAKAKDVLARLYYYYAEHPHEMPEPYYSNTERESVERCVCDFIAGMTDRFAIEKYHELFIPVIWRGK